METFIDAHVHVQPWKMMKPEIVRRMSLHRADMDVVQQVMSSPDAFLRHMDREGVERAALINYVSPHIMGFTEEVNDFISQYCKQDPSRLIAFGSIDPRKKSGLESEIDTLLEKKQIRGIKIHPSHQTVFPNDYINGNESLAYLYKKCEEMGIPVMFHTGTSIFVGARNRFADPIYVDDVAVDFPKLKMILAHGGRPIWMDTCIFLVRRFPNVYMDVSSIPPSRLLQYFPPLESLADKVLFGTDWPAPLVKGMRKNYEEFRTLPLSTEAFEKISRANAASIF